MVNQLIKNIALKGSQHLSGRIHWSGAVAHGQPKDSPADKVEDGHQIGQALRGSQLGFLCFATRLQYLMKGLDLPAHRIPIEFFDSLAKRFDGQIVAIWNSYDTAP